MITDNYKVFKAAHLHSKFWTHNSVMVPSAKVVINEDFVDIRDILRIPAQYQHFKVYWIVKGVSGMVCIPGEWNYCYIDGKFYHLVKGESNGFIKDIKEEWFYYSVVYDDWQNEWLTNNFEIKGTINLTGDKELALRKINMIQPLIHNVNRWSHLNGIVYTKNNIKYETHLKLPETTSRNFLYPYDLNSFEKQRINDLLTEWHAKIGRGELPAEPPMERLHIPLLYKLSRATN